MDPAVAAEPARSAHPGLTVPTPTEEWKALFESSASSNPLPSDLPEVGSARFTVAEIRHHWAFLDGAIMDAETRRLLHESWGLCPRHAWGYAVTEIEVRGGEPFSTSILYEDLVARAAARLGGSRPMSWSRLLRWLQSNGECPTCGFQALPGAWRSLGSADMVAQVNSLERTVPLLQASEPVWRRASCPHCLGGTGPPCVPHLRAGVTPPERVVLAEYAGDLQRRLKAFVRSLTHGGAPATRPEQASWVEALGWLASWRFADRLLEAGGAGR